MIYVFLLIGLLGTCIHNCDEWKKPNFAQFYGYKELSSAVCGTEEINVKSYVTSLLQLSKRDWLMCLWSSQAVRKFYSSQQIHKTLLVVQLLFGGLVVIYWWRPEISLTHCRHITTFVLNFLFFKKDTRETARETKIFICLSTKIFLCNNKLEVIFPSEQYYYVRKAT